MSRVKYIKLSNRAEFELIVNRIAELELKIRSKEADRDAAIQKIQNDFTPLEDELKAQLKGLISQAGEFAEEHREDLFPHKAKSAQTSLAIFGFRLGNPTLSLLNKSWSWTKVVKALKDAGHAALVQTFEEPRKDAIKTSTLSDMALAACGMKKTQSETFFIEPKLEGADAVKAEPISA